MGVRRSRRWHAAAVVLLVAAALTGCEGSGGGTAPSGAASTTPGATASATPSTPAASSPAPSPTAPREVRTAVYFLHGGKVSAVPRTVKSPSTAAEALRALLAGPDARERGYERTTAIPDGTALRSVALRARVATVDLSGRFDDGGGASSMRARLAQVVYTATRFPSIGKVAFRLDGKPVTSFGGEGVTLDGPVGRADFEEETPVVLVESPLLGDTVDSPLRVRGTANTFEAEFRLKLTDAAGKVVADVLVMATSGSGTRGTFDTTLTYRSARAGKGVLTAYVISAENGRVVTVDTVPLDLKS
ncbi:Gmad2 immunoglobulin-like domain-containing protein [Streptomyces sp. NPDC051940]|uniref:GerMN domain-containing protein n=1 Tax=Streptomyces sp. NPDC051940 TaxID=3155675 RepID=UPI003414C81B